MPLDTAFAVGAAPLDAAPATTFDRLHVETLTRLADAEALADDWLALERRQQRAAFFQSCGWCLYVWRTRENAADGDEFEPRLMVIRDGASVVAIWPLAVRGGAGGRVAQDLTEPFGQYSDILVRPGADSERVRIAAFAELERWRVDGLVLRKVRADSLLATWLAVGGVSIGAIEGAPQISLETTGGHDAYRRSLNAKTRKHLRNYRNRVSREGTLTHTLHDEPAAAGAIIQRCFDGRTGWLETSGLSSTAFADSAFADIVDGLAARARGAPPVVAMRLALASGDADSDDIDLSLHWGFEHAGRYYAFMASKNPAYDAFSPGRLHLEDVVAALDARGNGTIDLLVPALPYKLSFATETVKVSGYGVPFTLRGRLAIHCWHGRLRPAIKAVMLALPTGVRRKVMACKDALHGWRTRMATVSAAPSPSHP